MNNIKLIKKELQLGNLSYKRYLSLASVQDNLSAFLAYNTLKNNPHLKDNDSLHFKNNLKSLKNLQAIVTNYCDDHQDDKICICYGMVADAKKMLTDVQAKNKEIEKKNEAIQTEYDKKKNIYIKTLDDHVIESWQKYKAGGTAARLGVGQLWPIGYEIVDVKNSGYPPAYDTIYVLMYTLNYKNALIELWESRSENRNPIPEDKNALPSLNIQCCNSIIDVQNINSIRDVLQVTNCTQSNTDDKKPTDDKKKADDEKKKAEEEKKKAEEEEKKAEEENLKSIKQKKIILFSVTISIILLIFIIFFFIYKYSK